MNRPWFEVDRAGLKELHGALPPERLALELIQNAFDERVTRCEVWIDTQPGGTTLKVTDDSPDGFADLKNAYTLFASTKKRSDPTKRGRFNFGEKIVLSRARTAQIASTKGCVWFDEKGRHANTIKRASGTEVLITFPRWTNAATASALEFLGRVIPPVGVNTTINGILIPWPKPERSAMVKLATELLTTTEEGQMMSRTARQTGIDFYPKRAGKAWLYELGIPVCEIAGTVDVNVHQKVPLSQDRTSVTEAFLQDIYAEIVAAYGNSLDAEAFGREIIQLALADERVTPAVAKHVFTSLYGETAAIQSNDPDADQEAARAGWEVVSGRTFGAAVNNKLRAAGVATTLMQFGRQAGGAAEDVPESEWTAPQRRFVAYVRMLAREVYSDRTFRVSLGRWDASPSAMNFGGNHVQFHVSKCASCFARPVSVGTSLALHELAHCKGSGHNGVYDTEFERNVNRHTVLLATRPELYKEFEPELWPANAR